MADSDEVRFSIRTNDNDWGLLPNPGFTEKVSITHPKNNSTLNTVRADIQGTCSADEVRIVVYNSGNREVSRQTLRVRDGRWSTSINLPSGRYRVLAKTLNGRGQDELSFNYKTGTPGGGNFEDLVTITWPRDNSTVASMSVDIQGTSLETDVNIKVYNTRGNILVANQSVAVTNGRWSTTIRGLANGKYRVVVSSSSGKDTDELTFTRVAN
jgi:flagellar hook assembly protein FlgD